MSAEMAQKLVQGGIKAVRSGDHALARKAFTQALKLDPDNEAAWLGMATITEGATDKLRILNRVLEINPDNERAKEAIRRLGGGTEASEEDSTVSEPEVIAEPETFTEPRSEPDEVFASGEIQPITDMPSGDTGDLSDFPKPDWALDEDVLGVDDVDVSHQPDETVPPMVIRSSEEVFGAMPRLPGGGAIPVPNNTLVMNLSEDVDADVQAYLEETLADYLSETYTWTRKTRGRAGSTEYRSFLLQAISASFVSIVIVAGILVYAVLTNPTLQRVLLPPTIVPTSTPTNTPTATPGLTNTPSPTPPVPATETPELPIRAELGFPDPHFPPTPTEIYYPDSVFVERTLLDEAQVLMESGELDEARQLIDEAVAREIDTGEIPPTMRLSQWHLLNGDSESARQVLIDWEERWQDDASLYDNSEASLLLGLARVDVYEATNGIGDRFALLDQAQSRLERSLGLAEGDQRIIVPDGLNAEGYMLLAEARALRGDVDGALVILDTGLDVTFQQTSLLENTALRMKKVEILVDALRYPEAFQELYFILQFNPFHEDALILQAELALETGQAGLGVLYSQQYLLYYPGSLQGFYLLGQSREAENKFDLALNAYSRAVAGDRENEEYTSDPYFLANLLARAELYGRLGLEVASAEDFSDALDFSGNDPALRIRRLQADYATGNYENALIEAEDLLNTRGANEAEVLYYQGLTWFALEEAGDRAGSYADAADALSRAVTLDLPTSLRTNAYEQLARAQYEVNSYEEALNAINQAIDSNSTAYRIYLRGLILQGMGNTDEALLDMEYIVTWGQYFNFPFYDDALSAYERLGGR